MQISDLDEIDSTTASLLQNLEKESKKLSDEEFEYLDQKFTTVLSNCDEVNLKPDGDSIPVLRSTFEEYKNLVLKARSSECLEQIKAV